jgi:sulfate/thiosulfate transport system ATP-binding protein
LFFRPNHARLAGQEGGDIRRLELEVDAAHHRCEIDVPADADVPKTGRVAVKPAKWRLFPNPA